ncbi:hypothetical protein ACODNH_06985 [Haloarcula sp. NS06]|uniref:hypothetical protein n=1 Tax=Haloarcula sp. NS06 TaxID=3409688 RepID=UPI003DA6D3AB
MYIEAGTVYEHDKHGEVVVLDILRVYQIYESDTAEGTNSSVVVRLADEWDAYGPLWGRSQAEPLNAFLTAVGDPIDNVTFSTPEMKGNSATKPDNY